jgi:hypothetical protein
MSTIINEDDVCSHVVYERHGEVRYLDSMNLWQVSTTCSIWR